MTLPIAVVALVDCHGRGEIVVLGTAGAVRTAVCACRKPAGADIARTLRGLADSYARDARALDDDDDLAMSVAYRTVAVELRKAAHEIEAT